LPSGDRSARKIQAAPRFSGREAGFTLVEVLVVLAIVGLAASTVAWALKPMRERTAVMRTIAAFKDLSEAARARAFESGDTVALTIDTRKRTLDVADLGRKESLPPEVDVDWVSASVSGHRSDQAGILFLPDGTSTGGRLSARAGGATAAVRISWVSGAAQDEP
jgi:general secretion pathway protein H